MLSHVPVMDGDPQWLHEIQILCAADAYPPRICHQVTLIPQPDTSRAPGIPLVSNPSSQRCSRFAQPG